MKYLFAQVSDKWQQLGNVQGVKSAAQPSPGKIFLDLEAEADPDDVINALVQIIVNLRSRIRSIGMVEPSLDDIYSNYVRESETA